MKPFVIKSLEKPNALQKLFGQTPKMNSFIEVNNLLACNDIDEITFNQIDEISRKYETDVIKNYSKELLDLYRIFVSTNPPSVTTIEKTRDASNKLRDLLGLKDNVKADEIWNVTAIEVYKEEFRKVIADGQLPSEKEEYLSKLAQMLNIPENVSDEISKEIRIQKVQSQINKIIEDGRVSPQEEQELYNMARNLTVEFHIEGKNQEAFEKMKALWKIENEDLPIISTEIILPKKEICYYHNLVDWYEYRTITTRVNYGGPTFRIKIAKGLYYRAGSLGVGRESREDLKKIDEGSLYITNKRLLFRGTTKNMNIQLDKIIDLEKYSDGFKIVKDSGRNVLIITNCDIDVPVAIIAKLIKNS
jgi:hypothetical protein